MTGGTVRSLHVIGNLEVGGAQEVVRSLAPALAALGCTTAVVALRDGPMRAPLEQAGIRVRVIQGRSRSMLGDPRGIGELWRIRNDVARTATELGADVIQTHLLRSLDFLMLTIARRSRLAVVWTFHNARLDLRPDQAPGGARLLGMKRRAYRALYHYLSRRSGAMVAVSSEVAAAIRRDLRPPRDRLVVIPNGVDVSRYPSPEGARATLRASLGVGPHELLITCVAKLYEQKGHRHLLEAFAETVAADERVRLAVVGDGPLRQEIAARIQELGIAPHVLLLGQRTDIADVLTASDVFVLPSLWEGLPMALLEAMAAGLPVIASRVSGTEEVLLDQDAGVLVEPGEVAPLARAMTLLAADAAARERLGEAARRRVVDAYSVEAQARAHLELYRRVTGQGRTVAR